MNALPLLPWYFSEILPTFSPGSKLREKLQGGKIADLLPRWIYSVNPQVETGRAFCPWDQNKQDLERVLTNNAETLAIGRIEDSPEGVISGALKGVLRPNPPPSHLLITEIHR